MKTVVERAIVEMASTVETRTARKAGCTQDMEEECASEREFIVHIHKFDLLFPVFPMGWAIHKN